MSSRCRIAAPCSVAVALFLPIAALRPQPAPAAQALFTVPGVDVAGNVAESPDHRWIVYDVYESERQEHLFVRSAAGGPAVRLTTGATANMEPHFTPAGDRIIYASTLPARAGEAQRYLMAIPFDPRTGRATGAPRQITLDPVLSQGHGPNAVAISPDGRWVAYVACCEGPSRKRPLRIVPSVGGNARTLVEGFYEGPGGVNLAWSLDGRSVLYAQPNPVSGPLRVMRVALDGGAPVVERESPGPGLLAPGARAGARVIEYGPRGQQRELRIVDAANRVVARAALPNGFDIRSASWAPDGKSLVGTVREPRAAIRLAPTDGGPSRPLTAGQAYDWPNAWTADSHELFVATIENGRPITVAVSREGAIGTRLPAEVGDWNAVVGRYAIATQRRPDSNVVRRVGRSLDDGRTLVLSSDEARGRLPAVRGPGGVYNTDGDALVYIAPERDRAVVRSVVPGRSPRTLHTFPLADVASYGVGVQNGRVAYTEPAGDSMRVMLVAPGSVPRRLAAVPAADPHSEVAWTSDGRHLAFMPGGAPAALYILDLAPDGTPDGPPRRVELPFEYAYEFSFLPDGRRLTMVAQPRGGPNAMIALVSLDDPSHPHYLNEDDRTSSWGHLLSPDGKWVAYAAELPPKGTTVYRVDLSSLARPAGPTRR